VGRRDQFDRVVIETTGVANPAPIIQTFFLDPDMASSVRLDGIVTMVDAKHVGRHLDEQVIGRQTRARPSAGSSQVLRSVDTVRDPKHVGRHLDEQVINGQCRVWHTKPACSELPG